jgi:hypothetical protein
MGSQGPRYRFVIEVDPIPDALLRILGPFAVRDAMLVTVRHDGTGTDARTELEAVGLSSALAELIGLRLAQMPCVRSVHVREVGQVLEMAAVA